MRVERSYTSFFRGWVFILLGLWAVHVLALVLTLAFGAPQRTVMFAVDVAKVPVLVTKAVLIQIQCLVTGTIYAASMEAQMFADCFGEVGNWNNDDFFQPPSAA